MSNKKLLLKIEENLGDTTRKFLLWHDGSEWIISLNSDMEKSKTLSELLSVYI